MLTHWGSCLGLLKRTWLALLLLGLSWIVLGLGATHHPLVYCFGSAFLMSLWIHALGAAASEVFLPPQRLSREAVLPGLRLTALMLGLIQLGMALLAVLSSQIDSELTFLALLLACLGLLAHAIPVTCLGPVSAPDFGRMLARRLRTQPWLVLEPVIASLVLLLLVLRLRPEREVLFCCWPFVALLILLGSFESHWRATQGQACAIQDLPPEFAPCSPRQVAVDMHQLLIQRGWWPSLQFIALTSACLLGGQWLLRRSYASWHWPSSPTALLPLVLYSYLLVVWLQGAASTFQGRTAGLQAFRVAPARVFSTTVLISLISWIPFQMVDGLVLMALVCLLLPFHITGGQSPATAAVSAAQMVERHPATVGPVMLGIAGLSVVASMVGLWATFEAWRMLFSGSSDMPLGDAFRMTLSTIVTGSIGLALCNLVPLLGLAASFCLYWRLWGSAAALQQGPEFEG